MQKIIINKLNINLKVELSALEKDNFTEYYSSSQVLEELTNNIKHYFGAYIDNVLVGFIGGMIIDNEAEILRIAVNKNYRKLGIGNKLLNYFEKYCVDLKVKKIFLEVNESNSNAINLYKKNLFNQINIRKEYYNKTDDAIIFAKEL